MKASHSIEWVPASPKYILTCLQEERWQCRGLFRDTGEVPPTFATTVRQWREAIDLVWWGPLGDALKNQWGANSSQGVWYGVLERAGQKTLGDVCCLLARQARQPHVAPVKLLGHECPEMGVILAIRTLLVLAGASPALRPSIPLESYLKKWPDVFLREISSLAPGGVPLSFKGNRFKTLAGWSLILGIVLLGGGGFSEEPGILIAGVLLFGLGWFGGFLGGSLLHGPLEFEGVSTFRGLTKHVLKQQGQCGLRKEILS